MENRTNEQKPKAIECHTKFRIKGLIMKIVSLNLSLRFNGHFPGEPGLAGVY